MRRIWMGLSFMLVVPLVASAQRGGGGGMHGVGMGPAPVAAAPRGGVGMAPRPVARVAPGMRTGVPVVHRGRTGGTVNRNASLGPRISNLPVFSNNSNVPGLGFDFPHLAATNPQRGRRHRNGFGFGVPFGFDGFLLGSPGFIVDNGQGVEEAQPQGVPDDNAGANAVAADVPQGYQRQFIPYNPPASAAATAPAPAPKDVAEYVFVRRDGGLLFAVAYTWENGTLRYVTRDGMRKSVAQDSLDMTATQQFNEQRGLSFQLPA
jgi:hypothetical protein